MSEVPLPDNVRPRLAPAGAVERPDLPARERPFRDEDAAELKYELAVRLGPYARCGYCTFLPDYRVDLAARPECPRCRRVGTLARWHRWAPAMIVLDERANDWARRVAVGLGLVWPEMGSKIQTPNSKGE